MLALVAIFLWQCGSRQEKEAGRIQKLEQEFYDLDPNLNAEMIRKGDILLAAYLDFAGEIRDSASAPSYLFKAAELSLALDKVQQSLELFNRIIYQYPSYSRVPECLFLMGFIYENHLQNFGKAKEIYESFILRYPDHEFADDAALSIQNLGKTPEELVREFEKKNEVRL